MRTICFDLDGVICSQTKGDYENAIFDQQAISLINKLYDEGNVILVFTSRFMGRYKGDIAKAQKEGFEFTSKQLRDNGVKFHTLILGKPRYDVLIDDRAVFFQKDWTKIEKEIQCSKN